MQSIKIVEAGASLTDVTEANQHGWDQLHKINCPYTRPLEAGAFANPKIILDPSGILNLDVPQKVLCLASGGGQQGPLFASLGHEVTVIDISNEQLKRDKEVASSRGLSIKCIQGDAQKLPSVLDEKFDIIYQPVSSLYMQDLSALFSGVRQALMPDGLYYGEHWNGIWQQLPDGPCWNGHAYEIVRPATDKSVISQTNWIIDGKRVVSDPVYVFTHTPTDIMSAICAANLGIRSISEGYIDSGPDPQAAPNSLEHLSAYFPPILRILAVAG